MVFHDGAVPCHYYAAGGVGVAAAVAAVLWPIAERPTERLELVEQQDGPDVPVEHVAREPAERVARLPSQVVRPILRTKRLQSSMAILSMHQHLQTLHYCH